MFRAIEPSEFVDFLWVNGEFQRTKHLQVYIDRFNNVNLSKEQKAIIANLIF